MKITLHSRLIFFPYLFFLTITASAGPGIEQNLIEIQNNIPTVITELNTTQTSLNAIYIDMHATLTQSNNLVVETASIIPSMTTANSIKLDTEQTVTIDQAILAALVTTIATQTAIFPINNQALATANDIILESQQTFTTQHIIYTDALESMTTANAVSQEVHTTRSIVENIFQETQDIVTSNSLKLTDLNTAQTTLTSIKGDTATLAADAIALSLTTVSTASITNIIQQQTIVLTVPVLGGTISTPGSYKLKASITGQIVIASDDVYLSLNGYNITNNSGDAIVINDNHTNVFISNGSLTGPGIGSGYAGIKVGNSVGGCQNITIEQVKILSNDYGIRILDNAVGLLLRGLLITDCYRAIYATNTSLLRMRYSTLHFNQGLDNPDSIGVYATTPALTEVGGIGIYNCNFAGFATSINIDTASDTVIKNCILGDKEYPPNNTTGTGIHLSNCANSIITDCIIRDIFCTATATQPARALFVDSSDHTIILNSTIERIGSSFSLIPTSTSYGIHILNSDRAQAAGCLISSMSGNPTVGIMVEGTSSSCIVRDNIIIDINEFANANSYSYQTTDTVNNFFTRNIATDYNPNNSFGSIPNVTTGYVSGANNIMYNYAFQ